MDTHISPHTRPWFEYTIAPTQESWTEFLKWTEVGPNIWCKGDWCAHLKWVTYKKKDTRVLSLRHKEDKPERPWKIFYDAKCFFFGLDTYVVEIYPPHSELRDTSNTYYLIEVYEPIGFSYIQ